VGSQFHLHRFRAAASLAKDRISRTNSWRIYGFARKWPWSAIRSGRGSKDVTGVDDLKAGLLRKVAGVPTQERLLLNDQDDGMMICELRGHPFSNGVGFRVFVADCKAPGQSVAQGFGGMISPPPISIAPAGGLAAASSTARSSPAGKCKASETVATASSLETARVQYRSGKISIQTL
jgi:hypothetical protein